MPTMNFFLFAFLSYSIFLVSKNLPKKLYGWNVINLLISVGLWIWNIPILLFSPYHNTMHQATIVWLPLVLILLIIQIIITWHNRRDIIQKTERGGGGSLKNLFFNIFYLHSYLR